MPEGQGSQSALILAGTKASNFIPSSKGPVTTVLESSIGFFLVASTMTSVAWPASPIASMFDLSSVSLALRAVSTLNVLQPNV